MLAASCVKCPDSQPSETWVFSPHNFGLWVESRAHTQLPQSCLLGLNSPDMQNGSGTHRELQASQRQEVIWLAWNFIKLWVELHGGRERLSKRPPFIDQGRLQRGEEKEKKKEKKKTNNTLVCEAASGNSPHSFLPLEMQSMCTSRWV